jgi:hypothetical protein
VPGRSATRQARNDDLEVICIMMRWISLAVLTATVGILGLVPAAQAEVRVSLNDKLDSDSSPFRGRDQPGLAVNPANPQHVVQINANYLDLTCEGSVSSDGGETWSDAVPLAPPRPSSLLSPFEPSCSSYQSIEFGSGDNVYATATAGRTGTSFADSSTLVFKSEDGGRSWESVVAMEGGPGGSEFQTLVGPSYSRPSLSVHAGAAGGEDRVYVVARESRGTGKQVQCASGTRTVPCTPVKVAVSNDGGGSFGQPVDVSPEPTNTTDAPSKPVVNPDGSVTVVWRTQGTVGLLQAARSTDAGRTWSEPVDVAEVVNTGTSTSTHVQSDPLTGQSTSASYPRMTGNPTTGDLYLVYNQGSLGPNPPDGGYQGADHFISPDSGVYLQRSTDGGRTWNEPTLINDTTLHPGTEVVQTRHPSVSVSPDGRVNVVWLDRRHWYQGPGERTCTHTHIYCEDVRLSDTYYSYSTDEGRTFSRNIRITDESFNSDVGYDTRPSAYWNYGPQAVTVGGGQVLVGWMDSREGNWDTDTHDIYLAKVNFDATGAVPQTNIDGSDPVSRSVALSKFGYEGGNEGALIGGPRDPAGPGGGVASRNTSSVVIANQDDVPGALAGQVLGRAYPAPVLLSPAGGLPDSVKAEVSRLRPARAFVIGDSASLSAQVVTDLAAAGVDGGQITRLSGGNDAARAAAMAAEFDRRLEVERAADSPAFDAAVIANPASPDAVAVAGLAAARRLPILYVNSGSIPSETRSALESLDIDETLVIGGASSVSGDVLADLPSPKRLGGDDQYETSRAVVEESEARGLPSNVVYVADGSQPMDAALLGGAVARKTGMMVLAPAPLQSTSVSQASSFGLSGISRFVVLGSAPDAPPVPGPVPGPPPASPAQPAADPCGTPGAAGYLNPAKMRVSRARVLRGDRRLDVLAPITARARGAEVSVLYQGDGRQDTFEVEVTGADTELDEVRILKPLTRGQAELGTGIVNLNYLGNAATRPQLVRLRAARRRAELAVEEISLIGDRLSAEGSVTRRAEGIVRLLYSYVAPDGSPQVHDARAEIQEDGDWVLEGDQVPAQLARCGGYLSIQFTGYFERRVRGEQLAYELNAGQTRRP